MHEFEFDRQVVRRPGERLVKFVIKKVVKPDKIFPGAGSLSGLQILTDRTGRTIAANLEQATVITLQKVEVLRPECLDDAGQFAGIVQALNGFEVLIEAFARIQIMRRADPFGQ